MRLTDTRRRHVCAYAVWGRCVAPRRSPGGHPSGKAVRAACDRVNAMVKEATKP